MNQPMACPGCAGRGFHLVLLDEHGRLRMLWIADHPLPDSFARRGLRERLCGVCQGTGMVGGRLAA